MNKLIIFDLDGTILNTTLDMTNAMNHILKSIGGTPITEDDMRVAMTKGRRYLIEKSFSRVITDEENISIQTKYNNHYFKSKNIHTKPFSGIEKLLSDLKDEGYLLAVCSNKLHDASSGLIAEIFPNTFDYVLGRSDKFPTKPSKEMIVHIIDKLNVDKNNVVYLGDTATDMKAAINAEVFKIAVTYGFGSKESLLKYNPEAVANHPDEIYSIITNYFK